MTDGATPLFSSSSEEGHLEIVRFLVESGANKDQGKTDDGATPLCFKQHLKGRTLKLSRFLIGFGAKKDTRHDRGSNGFSI